MTTKIPPPPEGRFGAWAYQLWDYVAKNRSGVVNARISGTGAITVSSSGTGSFSISHGTSGVSSGTYGGSNVFSRFNVSPQGHITSATNVNTLAIGPFGTALSLVAVGAVTGTTTTGTLTTAGGASTIVAVGAITGTSTTGTLTAAFTPNPSFAGTGTTAGWLVTGTETAAMYSVGTATGGFARFGTGTFASVLSPDLGTFARFNSLVGAGDVLGTSTTNTFTGALSTTGITAGAFGGVAGIPRFDISAAGRVTSGLNIVLQATSPVLLSTTGTGTIAWSHATSGVGTGLPGQTVLTYEGLDAYGHSTSVGTITAFSLAGTATMGGLLSTRALRAAIGSSASQGNTPVTGYADANPVSLTTVAGTLMRYGVPSSALAGSGQGMRWKMWGTSQLGPGTTRFALQFGTATMLVATSTQAPANWECEGDLIAQSNANQEFTARFSAWQSSGLSDIQIVAGTLGMSLTTVTTLCMVGTGTLASNTKAQRGMMVDIYGLQ